MENTPKITKKKLKKEIKNLRLECDYLDLEASETRQKNREYVKYFGIIGRAAVAAGGFYLADWILGRRRS